MNGVAEIEATLELLGRIVSREVLAAGRLWQFRAGVRFRLSVSTKFLHKANKSALRALWRNFVPTPFWPAGQ
jgi:hypothetical protein